MGVELGTQITTPVKMECKVCKYSNSENVYLKFFDAKEKQKMANS